MEWTGISASNEPVRVRTEDIVLVKADGDYSDLLLTNGRSLKTTFGLEDFFEDASRQLRRNFFVRVGGGVIVNRRFMCFVDIAGQTLTLAGHPMAGEVRVKASRAALRRLVRALLEGEEGGTGDIP